MSEFAILTNRRRAVIALVHSLAFLFLALWQLLGGAPARGILAAGHIHRSILTLGVIYAVVSAILLWLFRISGVWIERLYFALCAISATSGLLRTILGDQRFHSGRLLRAAMLGSAVIIGLLIVRLHSAFVENKSEA